MSEDSLVLRSMSEVVAAVPHFLGVHPQESLVVVPEVTGPAPVARVNMPRSPAQSWVVAEGLDRAYAGTAVGVVLLAYTDRPDLAREVCEAVRQRLEPAVAVIGAVAVDGVDWVRLDGAHPLLRGRVSQSERDLMTAEFLFLGRPTPFATPDQLRQAYAAGRRVPEELMVLEVERAAAAARGGRTGEVEREWITTVLDRATAGHTVLPDSDAARLIADVQHTPLRDHAWASIERETAPRHAELFRDLLTRCPDGPASRPSSESPVPPVPPVPPVSSVSSVSPVSPVSPVPRVAPVASLTAFAHWLEGDAVKARVALGRIPAGTDYQMARLIDLALEIGMNPRDWAVPDKLGGLDCPHPEAPEQPRSEGRNHANHENHEPPAPRRGRGNDGPRR